MSTRFFADYDLKELQSRLKSIIEVENKDSFRTHFRQAVLLRDECKVSGTVTNDNFKIWTHEQGRSGATGIFYPVIEGRPRPLSQGLEIEFKSRMNFIGRTLFLLLIIMLAYGILTGIVIQENNELKYLVPRFLIGTVLFGLMISVPTFIHFRASKITKEYLVKELELRDKRLK
jgi:hypothetical protein